MSEETAVAEPEPQAPPAAPTPALDAMFRDLTAKIGAEKDAKIAQLKAALWRIKTDIDDAIANIDLEAPPAAVGPEPDEEESPRARPSPAKPKKPGPEPTQQELDERPFLVDLSKDLDAKPLLEQWATTAAHHLRYKIAEHLLAIGHEIEGECLLLRGGAEDTELMAARGIVTACISYTAAKENELRMLRGGIERLFGRW